MKFINQRLFLPLITFSFCVLLLQSCWLKKCDDPDAEHRSWTMVPEGRTTPMFFKSSSGKVDTFEVTPPRYSNLGSSMDACTGTIYTSHLRSYNQDLGWSAVRYANGKQEIGLIGLFSQSDTLVYSGNILKANFLKSPWSRLNLKSVFIKKDQGIFQMNINDTIYDKIN
jgi:hypothetical protein